MPENRRFSLKKALFRPRAIGAALALLSGAAWAADLQGASAGSLQDSAWVQSDMEDAYAVDNLTNGEKQSFGYQFLNSGFRDCDAFPFVNTLPFAYSASQLPGSNAFVETPSGSVTRQFLRDPKFGKLFIDDEANLSPALGASHLLTNVASRVPLFIFGSANLSGNSGVARPLPDQNSCRELKRFLKLTDFKTVLPLNGSRIAQMIPGEIWRVPVAFTVRVGPSGGYSPTGSVPNLLSGIGTSMILQGVYLTVSVSAGASKTTTVTLRRLDEKSLRVRIRLGQARIMDAKGQLIAAPPMISIAGPAVSRAVGAAVGSYVAEQILSAVSAQFTLDHMVSSGNTAILEYILDPGDAEQMEALARLLNGDLNIFKELARFKSLLKPSASVESQKQELSAVEKRHSSALGADPSYVGVMIDKSRLTTLSANIPFAGTLQRMASHADDTYVQFDSRGTPAAQTRLLSEGRAVNLGVGNVPFLGRLMIRNRNQSVQTFALENADETTQAPAVVYVDQRGALRRAGRVASKDLERINSIMGLVGTHGEGLDSRMEIPAPAVMPPAAARGVKKYAMNFSLYLSSSAVQRILSSSREEIEKAYRNAFPFRRSARTGLTGLIGGWVDALGDVRRRRQAERLARDIRDARGASDDAGAASALTRLWSGKGASKLAYSDVYKVVLQLVDPSEVAAELTWSLTQKVSQSNSASLRFLFNPDLFNAPAAKDFARMKSRYIPPQPLSD